MKYFSQLDPKWRYIKHGNTDYTIGETGCLITILAIWLNHFGYEETPKTVNEKLTQNNGYVYGNILNWTSIPKIWKSVTFIQRISGYDNDLILKHLPTFVRTSFYRAVGGYHWVLFTGNYKLIDPLDGEVKNTSVYNNYSGFSLLKNNKIEQSVNINAINAEINNLEQIRNSITQSIINLKAST